MFAHPLTEAGKRTSRDSRQRVKSGIVGPDRHTGKFVGVEFLVAAGMMAMMAPSASRTVTAHPVCAAILLARSIAILSFERSSEIIEYSWSRGAGIILPAVAPVNAPSRSYGSRSWLALPSWPAHRA